MKLTLKNVKTWSGREGHAYQATLYIDGIKAAMFTDDASGGPMNWDVLAPDTFGAFASANNVAMNGTMVPCMSELDDLAAKLVDAWEYNKGLKRLCAKKTLFTLPGDKAGEFRTILRKYDSDVKAHITAKYPTATIINETL